MGLLISKSDFIGRWDVAKYNKDNIDAYIEEYEERYLTELLGDDLYALFAADVDPITHQPVTPIYQNIYNTISIEFGRLMYRSAGMKEMILGLVYFDYVRDNPIKQTMAGPVRPQSELATAAPMTFLYRRYNDSIDWYEAIQRYIVANRGDYPTFKGVYKRGASFI